MAVSRIRIAVDAMGGDHAPHEIVKGAILGARAYNVALRLVGLPEAIENSLKSCSDLGGLDIEVVPATETIEMDEQPATAVRRKKNASIVVAARCVSKGEADALVGAGNTGAILTAATLIVGRIEGVHRAAIGVVMPSSAAHCLLLDVGANDECNPEWLVQFANMGTVYMQNVRGIASPRVGLLNIGKEQGKGTAFVNAVYELLAQDAGIQFIGNVEGRDIFNGSVDVAVCDGFTGNIALKSAEGMVKMMQSCMKTEFTKSWRTKLGALLAKPAFAGIKHQVDPDEYGGALFLGVDGVCVKAHGGSKASAIQNAIRVAKDAVDAKVLEKIRHQIKHNTMIQGSEAVSS